MAAWTQVSSRDFASFLRAMRKQHEVHCEAIVDRSLRVYYIGDYSYRSSKAIWVGKEERFGKDTYYYTAQP